MACLFHKACMPDFCAGAEMFSEGGDDGRACQPCHGRLFGVRPGRQGEGGGDGRNARRRPACLHQREYSEKVISVSSE